MTIKESLHIAKTYHKGAKKALECEILLSHLLKKDRIFLHLYDDFNISTHIIDELLKQIDKLNNGYPIEYITKQVGFFSQTFFIDEGALIPRPETEILVQKASSIIQKHNIKQIFEIGVGSGVISIMLCLLHNDLKVICTDISDSAIHIAKQNIALKSSLDSTLSSRISIIKTNLLDGIRRDKDDFIISNPPYIKNSYQIPKNLTFEPRIALFGGENGDEVIKKIIELDARFLSCEIGYNQEYIKNYLTKYNHIEFYYDYSSLIRGFIAYKK